MGGRDHSCEGCGRGGFNDPDGKCECAEAPMSSRRGEWGPGWPKWMQVENSMEQEVVPLSEAERRLDEAEKRRQEWEDRYWRGSKADGDARKKAEARAEASEHRLAGVREWAEAKLAAREKALRDYGVPTVTDAREVLSLLGDSDGGETRG